MKNIIVKQTNKFNTNESYEGESIEVKIEKMMQQEEPIIESMGYIQTERKDGVPPQYDIRTNRFEIAHEIMNKGAIAHDKGRDFRRNGAEKTAENSLSEDTIATPE